MNLDLQKQRVADLAKTIDESAAKHNMLIGRLHEAQFILQMLQDEEKYEIPKIIENEVQEVN